MLFPILIINLDKRKKNFDRTLGELKKVHLDEAVTRIKAVDEIKAKQDKFNYISQTAFDNLNNLQNTTILPTWGSVGCAISHINCWKMLSKMNLEYCLILEDDFYIKDINKFLFALKFSINYMKNENTLISMCSRSKSGYKINEYLYSYNDYFIGTNCYLINRSCANFLLNNINQITYQIDVQMTKTLKIFNKNQPFSYFLKEETSGVSWYEHLSDVQYYFINKKELYNLCNLCDLPIEIIDKIYDYLPKKELITNNNPELYNYN
jgi:GR25 family glycosyltransferase involved in LPS biosynthesis